MADDALITRRIAAGEPGFPAALARLPRPVRALWYRGRLPAHDQPAVAVVGARAATAAGCRLARELAGGLARRGYAVVSGGALGIDAAAHRGALGEAGATFAVLGCGVDVVYPDRHHALFADIAAAGGLLSEYPPGTPPRGGQFPVRNRLVVGLAQAALIVEANVASGALITARLAIGLGRRLLAVPGSPGTDALIGDGRARAVRDEADLAAALAGGARAARVAPAPFAPLLAVLRDGDAAPGEVARRLQAPLPAALGLLAEAELAGWVVRRPGGRVGMSGGLDEDTRGGQ